MRYTDLKRNMIVNIEHNWNVIVLPVTNKDINRGMNADVPGLYGFRGLWYKGNGTKPYSYGKIFDLKLYDSITLVRNNISGLSKKQLQEILK